MGNFQIPRNPGKTEHAQTVYTRHFSPRPRTRAWEQGYLKTIVFARPFWSWCAPLGLYGAPPGLNSNYDIHSTTQTISA